MPLFRNVLGALVLLVTTHTLQAEECSQHCKLVKVKEYFSALDRVAKRGSTENDSTENDIDALLALTHDDVNYLHIEYQANFNKADWHNAFLRNQKLGRYQNTKSNQIQVLDAINGKHYIAIEYSHGNLQDDGSWEANDKYLALFGFTDGKISLIKELW